MKLYFSGASCSLASQISLHEAGLAHQAEKVDLKSHTTANGTDYYTINAKGYVPALQLDDGSLLTEGVAILQYIADKAPASGLAPAAGTMERVRLQEWLTFISSEMHKGIGSLFDGQMPEEYKAVVRGRVGKRLDWLSTQLQGKAWLTGASFTVADAYLYTVLNWGQWLGIDLAQWPVVADYMGRVQARPKVAEARKAAGI